MTKSNGEKSGSKKKPHYSQQMKDEIERQKAEIEQLRRELAAKPGDFANTAVPPVAVEPVVPEADTADPLAWIDESVNEVHLVSRNRDMPGWTQRRHQGLKIGEHVAPRLRNVGYGPWVKNPFRYVGTHKQVSELRYSTRDFSRFTIERNWAEYVYSFDKNPLPKTTIIARGDYRGQNQTTMQPDGKRSASSGDPLREYVRYLLQTHPGRLWQNKDIHTTEDRIDENHPNPYSDDFAIMGTAILGGSDKVTDHVIGDVITKDAM